MATQETLNQVQQLYVAYYGRPADAEGLAFWADALEANGGDTSVIINDFGNSAEFEARFGEMSNEELVNNLYQQLFGRDADAEGLAFYTGHLESGDLTLAQIASEIAGGAQDNEDGDNDLTTLNNKVAAANLYTAATEGQHDGTDADNYAADWLATVNADTDVDAIDMDEVVANLPEPTEPEEPSIPGETFTLTEIPSQTETTLNWNGVDADAALAFLQSISDLNLEDLGIEVSGDKIVNVDNINISDTDNTSTVTVTLLDGTQNEVTIDTPAALYAEIIDGLMQSEEVTQTGIVLTPTENNGGAFENGYTTSGDDLIIAGRPELLHGAYIDGGAGYNTLEVDMKGFFAQPFQLHNIQEVQVQNLPNVYDVSQTILQDVIDGSDGFSANFPISSIDSGADSVLDLSRARDLEKLVINEAGNTFSGLGGDGLGNLHLVGIKGDAVARLEGNFHQEVNLYYGRGLGDAVELELANVTMRDSVSDIGATHLNLQHNAGTVNLLSEGRLNVLQSVDFGDFLRELNISGSGELVIDDALEFAFGEVNIDASANTGGIRLKVDSVAGESNLDDEIGFSEELSEVTIKGSQARDVIEIAGTADGVYLDIDMGAGRDTLILDVVDAGRGSKIAGDQLTLHIKGDVDLDLVNTDDVTVERVVLHEGSTLTLNQEQFAAWGGVLETNHRDTAEIEVIISEDTSLSELMADFDLDSNIKLNLIVEKGATLTLTAEELHKYVAFEGIDADMDGHLVITDAGLGFQVTDQSDYATGGTLVNYNSSSSQNITIERDASGYERPAKDQNTDILVIDSTDTDGVVVGANDLPSAGDDTDAFSLNVGTLVMQGDQAITFDAPVEFLSNNWTIDFSELSGSLNGLFIQDFQNITEAAAVADQGQIIGNPDVATRIDVDLSGAGNNVGSTGNENGLKSSGVETYVVHTDDANNEFFVCDLTEDLQTLGLQGTGNITFNQINWGTNLLLEGDGFENFGDIPKAFDNPNESNIGNLTANYFFPGATVDVDINNQGQALGTTSTGAPRPLVVESIVLNNVETANIAIADGNAVIQQLTGNFNGVDGGLSNVSISSDFDVTLEINATDIVVDGDDNWAELDASGVAGTMTLDIQGAADVDLSATELTGIDAIAMNPDSILTLNIDQIEEIGVENISFTGTAAQAQNNPAMLNIGEFAEQEFDIESVALGNGIELDTVTFVANADEITLHPNTNLAGAQGIVIPEGTTVNMTAEQYQQIVGEDGDGDIFSGNGTLNITDLQGEPELDDNDDVIPGSFASDIDLSGVPAEMMGTISLADGVDSMRLTGSVGEALFEETDGTTTQFVSVQTDHTTWSLTGNTQGFSFELDQGQNLVFTSAEQAHNRVIEGDSSKVTLGFSTLGSSLVNFNTLGGTSALGGLNLAYYSDLSELEVLQALVAGQNVEQILGNLNENTIVEISDVILGADEANPTFRNVEVLEGVTVPGDLIFENLNTDAPDSLKLTELSISLLGDATIDGTVDISGAPLHGTGFETLTLISLGDDPNAMGDIVATDNDLLDVVINAGQDLDIGTITFTNAEGPAETATLTVNGDSDVTIKALDTTDPDVSGYNLVNNLTGGAVLDITGGSAAFVGDETETLTLSGAGTTVFDSDSADDSTGGIDANILSLLDASEHTGDLELGRIVNVNAANFSLRTSDGNASARLETGMDDKGFNAAVVDYNEALAADPFDQDDLDDAIDALNAASTALGLEDANDDALVFTEANAAALIAEYRPEWNFQLGDNTELTIDGDEAQFTAGALVVSGGKLIIEGEVDLRGLDVLEMSNVEIELAAGARILMSDEQFEALDNVTFSGDGQTLEVDNALLTDLGNDITEVRGVTEIQLAEELTEAGAQNVRMTADQARIATVVDEDGNPVLVDLETDPTVINEDDGEAVEAGDFRTLTDSDVTIVVKGSDDLTDLRGVDAIDVPQPVDTLTVNSTTINEAGDGVTADNDQVAALLSDTPEANDLVNVGQLIIKTAYQTGVDPDTNENLFTTRDIVVDVTLDDGNVDSLAISGHAAAIQEARDGNATDLTDIMGFSEVAEVNWTFVGTQTSIVRDPLNAVADAVDTFTFVSNAVDQAEEAADTVTIAGFEIDAGADNVFDVLDFAALLDDGFTFAGVEADTSGDNNVVSLADNAITVFNTGDTELEIDDFGVQDTTNGTFADDFDGIAIVIGRDDAGAAANIYVVEGNGTPAELEIDLIGTMTGINAGQFTADSFGIA